MLHYKEEDFVSPFLVTDLAANSVAVMLLYKTV